MTLSVDQVAAKVLLLRQNAAERDGRMLTLQQIRTGNAESILPGMFPTDIWPHPITGNFVDAAARDLAEVIAPMPTVSCETTLNVSAASKKFAAKRTKVAHYYMLHSRLRVQMPTAADRYLSYGFLPFVIEPDFETKCPVIRLDDPVGAYPEINLNGRCVSYTRRWTEKAQSLIVKYPDFAA